MTFIRKFSLLILFSVLLIACKKKSNSSGNTSTTTGSTTSSAPTTNGSMSAKLNGASWTSVKNTAALIVDTDSDLSALVINGETASDIFALGIDFPTASTAILVGNHDMDGPKDDAVFTYTKKTSGGGTLTQHFPDEGTFNITSVDNTNKKISGTFSFTMHKAGSTAPGDSIKVTNGVFTNISFVVQ